MGPKYQAPNPPDADSLGNFSEVASTQDPVESAWWRQFNDPVLDRLIVSASANNLDLRRATARLREARALWTAARFDFAPTIRSEDSYDNLQVSRATKPNDTREGRHNELYRVGFDSTWELDVWGKIRRQVEAARATVESVAATRDEVLVAVRAEVAANYLELRGLQAQRVVAGRNATNQADTLQLAEVLRDGGQGTQLDVARARSLLHATLATIPPLDAAQENAQHRIAVLCGQPLRELKPDFIRPAPIPAMPNVEAIGNPADFLRRRPDVRAAERSLAAATARIGVEVAGLFPSVTFVGSLGIQANRLSGFGDAGTDLWGFGPHLSWAAFDLGRVRQRIRAADARAEGSLATYEQTVLLALEETETSLITCSRERQRWEHLRQSESAGAEAVELARQRYRDGIADFLSVLDAQRTLLNLQEQLVISETRAATSLVAVYKAMGGGWEEK